MKRLTKRVKKLDGNNNGKVFFGGPTQVRRNPSIYTPLSERNIILTNNPISSDEISTPVVPANRRNNKTLRKNIRYEKFNTYKTTNIKKVLNPKPPKQTGKKMEVIVPTSQIPTLLPSALQSQLQPSLPPAIPFSQTNFKQYPLKRNLASRNLLKPTVKTLKGRISSLPGSRNLFKNYPMSAPLSVPNSNL